MFNHQFFVFAIVFIIVALAITALVFFIQKIKRMAIEEAQRKRIREEIDARNLELWYCTDGRAHEWEYEKYPWE